MGWSISPEIPMLEGSLSGRHRVLWVVCFLIVLVAACSRQTSQRRLSAFAQDDVQRGEYLAKVFCCQECHTTRDADDVHLNRGLLLAGGVPFPGQDGSVVYSPNVTIASQYSGPVLDGIIRGRLAYKFQMPTVLYNGMAADDMRDLIAYIKTLRPVLRPLPDNHLPAGFVLPPPNPSGIIPEHEPPVGTVERGRYLSQMFACLDCHSPRDAGGGYDQEHLFEGGGFQLPVADGHLLIPPNITPDLDTGLGRWSDDEIGRAIRTGVARDGRQLDHVMPYLSAFHDMTDQDAADVVRFLRSVRPVNRSWPPTR
jgi:mono/diheme cytochrome c family protein